MGCKDKKNILIDQNFQNCVHRIQYGGYFPEECTAPEAYLDNTACGKGRRIQYMYIKVFGIARSNAPGLRRDAGGAAAETRAAASNAAILFT